MGYDEYCQADDRGADQPRKTEFDLRAGIRYSSGYECPGRRKHEHRIQWPALAEYFVCRHRQLVLDCFELRIVR